MKKGYTIKLERWIEGLGVSVFTLSKDNKFYEATRETASFNTLEQASRYWRSINAPFRGTDHLYIQGPRGGTHRLRRII